MKLNPFISVCFDRLRPGAEVLDLGAGDGRFSNLFAKHGAVVTAVDYKDKHAKGTEVDFVRMDIKDYIEQVSTRQYDLIFMRNVIQFLDKAWVLQTLLPWTDQHTKSGGDIAIETFHKDPRPPFAHPMRSLYTLDDLVGDAARWEVVYKQQYEHDGSDMSGAVRHFFTTDLIVKKK